MSDFLDDFNKILKKDLVPILIKYFKDPNKKITENLNDFLNDPLILLNDILDRFSKNKNTDIHQTSYKDIENINASKLYCDEEYDELLKRLSLIEENMIQIEKILKEKN